MLGNSKTDNCGRTVRQNRQSGRPRTTMILLDYYLFDRTVLVKAEATLA